MSDTHQTTPDKDEVNREYGFEPEADPVHPDEEQAEASEYGIYGYQSHSGEAYEGEPGEPLSPAPDAPPAPDAGLPENELPQPTEPPQRDVTSDG